jgi:hypothetical protein
MSNEPRHVERTTSCRTNHVMPNKPRHAEKKYVMPKKNTSCRKKIRRPERSEGSPILAQCHFQEISHFVREDVFREFRI